MFYVLMLIVSLGLAATAMNLINLWTKRFFELKALGITEIDSVHENFVKDIRFENGHYVVKLPWRQHHDILPDNFELSSGRLISTLKRLIKNPPLLKEYNRIINEQLQSGIIEQVYPSLVEPHDQRVHYLLAITQLCVKMQPP